MLRLPCFRRGPARPCPARPFLSSAPQSVLQTEVRQLGLPAPHSTLRRKHRVPGAQRDTGVPPPYVTSGTLPPRCLVGSRPGVSWRRPWRGMWAVAAARTRSCCCTLSCCPRSSSSSPWSRWGVRARLSTDGQPGGRAGLREARGRSPPTQSRWGFLPRSDLPPKKTSEEWLASPENPH